MIRYDKMVSYNHKIKKKKVNVLIFFLNRITMTCKKKNLTKKLQNSILKQFNVKE
jgi:hypothetical protein